jgi:hypothetical protein
MKPRTLIAKGWKMKPNATYAVVVYWIATVAATITLTTHVAQWRRQSNENLNPAVASLHVTAQAPVGSADMRLNGPFRDGLYMARLAQQRGEQRQPALARWATEVQRVAFSAGYDQGSYRIAQVNAGN